MTLLSQLDYSNFSTQLTIPEYLSNLVIEKQLGLVLLKIVEIIGEDEPHQLDPETIYFITNLLNKMNLRKIRNIVFNSALPLRT